MEERGYKVFASDEEEPDKDSEVFFNDEMLENRDLTEIALKVFRKKIDPDQFNAVDAMSASGIRGFRTSPYVDELFINDINPRAIENIEKGVAANNIDAKITEKDANVLLSEYRNYFHFIDIDPFGPFTNYLDSTARAANYQSFVGLTATDNAVPAGSYKKTCLRRYGSQPLKNSLMHETGLRIYIKEIFQNFSRYDKCFDPKLCYHKRHYSRVMGRVTESKSRTNTQLEKIGYMSFCPSCRWRKLERVSECENCGSRVELTGPLWTGKFIDIRFTEDMKEEIPDEWDSSSELLDKLHGEGEILTPFYDLHELCSNMGISSPRRDPIIQEIREKGYPVARTHFSPTGFRTDAPLEDIKSIIKSH